MDSKAWVADWYYANASADILYNDLEGKPDGTFGIRALEDGSSFELAYRSSRQTRVRTLTVNGSRVVLDGEEFENLSAFVVHFRFVDEDDIFFISDLEFLIDLFVCFFNLCLCMLLILSLLLFFFFSHSGPLSKGDVKLHPAARQEVRERKFNCFLSCWLNQVVSLSLSLSLSLTQLQYPENAAPTEHLKIDSWTPAEVQTWLDSVSFVFIFVKIEH